MSDCPTCLDLDCGTIDDLDLYQLEGPQFPYVLNCPPGANCNATPVQLICGTDIITLNIPTTYTPAQRKTIIQSVLNECAIKARFNNPNAPTLGDDGELYFSHPFSCTVYCNITVNVVNGVPVVTSSEPFTYRLAAGSYVGVNQISADNFARDYACSLAKKHRVCLSNIQRAFCIGEGFTATIKARGQFVSSFPNTDYWQISGTLPPGLTFHGGFISGGSALIDGTPTTAGLYNFAVKITIGSPGGRGDEMEKNYSLAIVSINTDNPLPELIVGTAYTQNLTVIPTHDQETEVWSVVGGSLPPGIELTPAGVLHGTPTQAGAFPFTASVTLTMNETRVTCEQDFTFRINDMPYDAAVYDSVDDLIIAVRGGRIFKCDPVTGVFSASSDFSQPGFSPASLAYDSGTNRIFAAVWNSPQFKSNSGFSTIAQRTLCKINPTSLAVEATYSFDDFIVSNPQNDCSVANGFSAMRAVGGWIYCIAYGAGDGTWMMAISAANPTGSFFVNEWSFFLYGACAFGVVSGNNVLFGIETSGGTICSYDFTATTTNDGVQNFTRFHVALEYAPVQARLYVTRKLQYIDKYTAGLVYVSTIDTGRANFCGVQARLSPYDGKIYIPGFQDHTVIVLNPADDSFVVKTGFELPCDIVFTPTKIWAVQQGRDGLKQIV